jgi:hypothetical protein
MDRRLQERQPGSQDRMVKSILYSDPVGRMKIRMRIPFRIDYVGAAVANAKIVPQCLFVIHTLSRTIEALGGPHNQGRRKNRHG